MARLSVTWRAECVSGLHFLALLWSRELEVLLREVHVLSTNFDPTFKAMIIIPHSICHKIFVLAILSVILRRFRNVKNKEEKAKEEFGKQF